MKRTRLANIAAAVAMANSSLPTVLVDNGNQRPGQICLANEARFNSAFYSEPVTNYLVGWKDNMNLQETLDFLFPPVQVGRRFEFKKTLNSEIFLSETDDIRAIGAGFKTVEYKGQSVNDKTLNKGLTIIVDKDDFVSQQPGWENAIAARLKQRLLRNDLRRGITLIATAANNTAKTWDTTALKDPDQDVMTQLNVTSDGSGMRANRVLYGEAAWTKRLLAHRAQTTAGGFGSANIKTPEELAGLFQVERIRISRERYQSAAAAKSKISPDIVLMFYGEDAVGPDDPTTGKRFWSPTESGGEWRVYIEPIGSKFLAITVEHYSNMVVTASEGCEKLTIT
jgi:hypothetical protein